MSNRSASKEPTSPAVIATLQSRLRLFWWTWLVYRGLLMPVLLGSLLSTEPAIAGGIFWHVMWLIPALVLTPWMVTGKSPYALLTSSMLTLVYFGGSGVTLFSHFYDNALRVIWIYGLDTILLLLINYYLFKLLKKLPSMNG